MGEVTKVLGLSELADALRALPVEIGSKGGGPLRRALRKAAGIMLLDARRRAPRGATGNLQKAIVLTLNRKPGERRRTEAFWLGVRRGRRYTRAGKRKGGQRYENQKGTAYYGRFVEFGTVNRPAHPFMRPAFEATKTLVVEMFKQELSKDLVRIASKLARMSAPYRRK
jgi:HK97 gp10 family phage protein